MALPQPYNNRNSEASSELTGAEIDLGGLLDDAIERRDYDLIRAISTRSADNLGDEVRNRTAAINQLADIELIENVLLGLRSGFESMCGGDRDEGDIFLANFVIEQIHISAASDQMHWVEAAINKLEPDFLFRNLHLISPNPLEHIIDSGNLETCMQLLDTAADRMHFKRHLLMAAISKGESKTIRALTEQGVADELEPYSSEEFAFYLKTHGRICISDAGVHSSHRAMITDKEVSQINAGSHPLLLAAALEDVSTFDLILERVVKRMPRQQRQILMDVALRISALVGSSAILNSLLEKGANINYEDGRIFRDTARQGDFDKIIYLLTKGIRASSLDALNNESKIQHNLLQYITEVQAQSRSEILNFVGFLSLKSDAFDKIRENDFVLIQKISIQAAVIAGILSDFELPNWELNHKELLKNDVMRVQETTGLSYRRYVTSLEEPRMPILDLKDVIDEVACCLSLPKLINEFCNQHAGRIPNKEQLESLQVEALKRASKAIFKNKTSLDLLGLNAKWHRGGNRCPDTLRPFIRLETWTPLFEEVVDVGDGYTVECLYTGDALAAEGSDLSHCVGGYSSKCAVGDTQILSLRKDGLRCATIELNKSAVGEITAPSQSTRWNEVQFRGVKNRKPSTSEKEAFNNFIQLYRDGRVDLKISPETKIQVAKAQQHQEKRHIVSKLGFELENAEAVRTALLDHYRERVVIERSGKRVFLIDQHGQQLL